MELDERIENAAKELREALVDLPATPLHMTSYRLLARAAIRAFQEGAPRVIASATEDGTMEIGPPAGPWPNSGTYVLDLVVEEEG